MHLKSSICSEHTQFSVSQFALIPVHEEVVPLKVFTYIIKLCLGEETLESLCKVIVKVAVLQTSLNDSVEASLRHGFATLLLIRLLEVLVEKIHCHIFKLVILFLLLFILALLFLFTFTFAVLLLIIFNFDLFLTIASLLS